MESQRQKKVAQLIQNDLSEILRKNMQAPGYLVSVSEVQVTPDLSIAKVYISVFPTDKREEIFKTIEQNSSTIRGLLGNKLSQVMRAIPELQFKMDTSQDHAEKVDKELKGKGDNPIL